MPIPQEGYAIHGGGCMRITFPNFNIDMSCDNETELASCIEMLKKGLEIFETEKAKRLLMEGIEEEERKKRIAELVMNRPTIMPNIKSPMDNTFATGPASITCSNP